MSNPAACNSWAKGCDSNALTIKAGLQFANLITGTIVVENVFVLPGVGRLVFQAISNRDLVVVRDLVESARV